MKLLGLPCWSPVTVVMKLGTLSFGLAPLVAGALISAAPSILGGIASIFGKKKAKHQQEEADYQAQLARNSQMMGRARAGIGRSKFIGSLMKAYGMDSVLGPDYFSEQNYMDRALGHMGYGGPAQRRDMGGGPGAADWIGMLGNAAVTGAGTYMGGKQAAADKAQSQADRQDMLDRLYPKPGGGSGGGGSYYDETKAKGGYAPPDLGYDDERA